MANFGASQLIRVLGPRTASLVFDAARLETFIREGTSWAAARHAIWHESGHPLSDQVLGRFGQYFAPSTLRRIRLVAIPSIPNPDFYGKLASLGIRTPLDFTVMAGLTLVDTVFIATDRADLSTAGLERLLFHEAVHVVQYEVLGVSRIIREYVVGWASAGFQYDRIPLEVQAYDLERRFAEGGPAFSVAQAVSTLVTGLAGA